MRAGILRRGAGVAAALAVLPVAAHADSVTATASASTAAMTLTVDPSALLGIPSADVQSLPQAERSLLTAALQSITVDVDGANATASRAAAADLVAGHADATPVSLDLASLSQLLSNLHGVLSDLAGAVTVPSLATVLAELGTITGDATVMGLLGPTLSGDLQALDTELGSLSADLTAMASDATAAVDALQSTLGQQVGALLQYATGVQADLDATHPQGQATSSAALTVPPPVSLPPLVPTLPVIAQLAPFGATAVDAAGATLYGASGPQASSNESTTNLDVSPAVDLTSLRADMAAMTTLLAQATATATATQPLLAAAAATIATVLPGGLSLTTLLTELGNAAAPAATLSTVAQDLELEKTLSCQTLGTGSCVIASTSITPAGTGLHAIATSKLVDMSVLPMGHHLATALHALGAVDGTPLLDVQGVQATSDAIVDGTTSTGSATGSVTTISVAGLVVMDNGQINTAGLSGFVPASVLNTLQGALPVGEPMVLPIDTGSGILTLEITLGSPQRTYAGPSHQSASLGRMQVTLLNGDTNGQNPVTALGAAGAGPLVGMNTAAVSSEVLGTSTTNTGSGPSPGASASASPSAGAGGRNGGGTLQTTGTLASPGSGSQVSMGKTGMVGPSGLLVGFGLVALGGWLQRRSRRGA